MLGTRRDGPKNDLREHVEAEIADLIEPEAWERCATVEEAEQESLRTVLDSWGDLCGRQKDS